MRRRPVIRAVVPALLLPVLVMTAPAVSAHTVLTSTDPVADSALTTGPSQVTATFNEDLQPTFASMTVVGPDGNLWSRGDAVVQGATARVGLRPLGPAGRYTVNYRVTSEDGHVVSGSWSFTVTAPSTGTPGPAVEAAEQHGRITLWPFIVGAAALIAGTIAWGLRHRS